MYNLLLLVVYMSKMFFTSQTSFWITLMDLHFWYFLHMHYQNRFLEMQRIPIKIYSKKRYRTCNMYITIVTFFVPGQ